MKISEKEQNVSRNGARVPITCARGFRGDRTSLRRVPSRGSRSQRPGHQRRDAREEDAEAVALDGGREPGDLAAQRRAGSAKETYGHQRRGAARAAFQSQGDPAEGAIVAL